MKFLILLAVIAAASAVPYFPYKYGFGDYGYGMDYKLGDYKYGMDYKYDVSPKFDYRTLMMGGSHGFLEKDITLVKKDFIIFYYKYLVDLLDIFKTRFNDILVKVDSKEIDTLTLPLYCKKMTGLMRWMMMMNIDFTKYDPHYFDMFMWCKISDYMMFMKYYWLHFNYSDVMHKDISFMRDIYSGLGHKFLYKFGDYYGKKYDGFYGKHFDGYYGDKFVGHKYFPEKYYGEHLSFDKFTPYYKDYYHY